MVADKPEQQQEEPGVFFLNSSASVFTNMFASKSESVSQDETGKELVEMGNLIFIICC